MNLQLALFNLNQERSIVNTASVPHRSLFRYPGGKTWLVPYLRQWLRRQSRKDYNLLPLQPYQLIEPFAGGGIISLTAIAEKLVDHVIMVEKDEEVAAVWQTVFDEQNWQWLMNKILSFDVTYENVTEFLARNKLTAEELAFKTILKNRVNRGGILAPRAGLLKNGENGKGLKSRWYPDSLSKRIKSIVSMQKHISFIHGGGIETIKNYANRNDTVFFIDPPYTAAGKKAGKRLYTYSDINHEELFSIVGDLTVDFLMTYDDTEEIRTLARSYNFDVESVIMKNTHHAHLTELLIGPNLDWVRQIKYNQ